MYDRKQYFLKKQNKEISVSKCDKRFKLKSPQLLSLFWNYDMKHVKIPKFKCLSFF